MCGARTFPHRVVMLPSNNIIEMNRLIRKIDGQLLLDAHRFKLTPINFNLMFLSFASSAGAAKE